MDKRAKKLGIKVLFNAKVSNIDVNCSDYDKRTPLHLASSEGCYDIVKFLLENGAKVGPADAVPH